MRKNAKNVSKKNTQQKRSSKRRLGNEKRKGKWLPSNDNNVLCGYRFFIEICYLYSKIFMQWEDRV